jgi:crotonobetainyl-CoA:carnitine CoA-transferase CaiB-like acyl-CoA transferase
VRVGVPVADLMAPAFGVIGILAALRQRETTGEGQHADVSMLSVLTSLVTAEPLPKPAPNVGARSSSQSA